VDADIGNGAQATQSPTPSAGDGDRGTRSLVGSIVADVSTLITKQVELAKQEIGEMVSTRAQAVGVFAAAAVLGLFVIGFLGLIVAVVFGILAAIAVLVARGRMRSAAAKPELTQRSLKEDVEWAKRQLTR
jgi:Putative Actinobacterial Holin-X, holin superfamily III